ncbi:MAG: Glucosamine-phosphate N-acetyltransferase-like protein [Alyxoria varia]|nr:MAG: Glucosamine-phosphate N-acetyltransferase-like protein [Alyxoria varia]
MSNEADSPLFSPALISPEVSASLPPNYTIRPLQPSDHSAGFLEVLKVLTSVGDISEQDFRARYGWMRDVCKETYYLLVILDDSQKIVGTGALVVERKFIHGLGLVGHVEDIAVARDQQGKKLGLRIIQALDFVAEKVGCYKVVGIIVCRAWSRCTNKSMVEPQGQHTLMEHFCLELTHSSSRNQTILDCSEANEGFYVKCGFKRAGLEMAHYYEKK